jgi:hypothetical protein
MGSPRKQPEKLCVRDLEDSKMKLMHREVLNLYLNRPISADQQAKDQRGSHQLDSLKQSNNILAINKTTIKRTQTFVA